MSWADLEWPDLSPDYPPPQPSSPPLPPPDAPDDIAEQVRRAERRRGVFVPLCVLVGAILFCAGVGLYRVTLSSGHVAGEGGPAPSPAALLLMLVGLLVATLLPALVVLLVIGPSWRQRQQHLALLHWERARGEWLSRERQRYLASLPQQVRAQVMAALCEGM